jgi:UDP-N-acetylglucosamine--N-acetylmuramyl-(pentapeptide) pyrophosphoryl-undecaprenol N-acetylglucosamine transferase
VFLAYEATKTAFPKQYQAKLSVSGNPIRADFFQADESIGRAFLGLKPQDRILLVLGGSQGARQVNELVREALPELVKEYVVVHQTGKMDVVEPSPAGDRYKPFPYIGKELPHILKACEMVIGRSGAGTIWEAAALGRPMVLIPLSGSGTRGDQVENAEHVRHAGAGFVLSGAELTASNLVAAVASIGTDESRRNAMGSASKNLASIDAVSIIADAIANQVQGEEK